MEIVQSSCNSKHNLKSLNRIQWELPLLPWCFIKIVSEIHLLMTAYGKRCGDQWTGYLSTNKKFRPRWKMLMYDIELKYLKEKTNLQTKRFQWLNRKDCHEDRHFPWIRKQGSAKHISSIWANLSFLILLSFLEIVLTNSINLSS